MLLFRTVLHFFNAIISFATRIPNVFHLGSKDFFDFFFCVFATVTAEEPDAISSFQFKGLQLFPLCLPLHAPCVGIQRQVCLILTK